MLYSFYEAQRTMLAGISTFASSTSTLLNHPLNPWYHTEGGTLVRSALDVFAHAARPYGKPDFAVDETVINGIKVPITAEICARSPFGQLKQFVRQPTPGVRLKNQPKLLVVAPMSGHFASLLRGTVQQMVNDHDVYLTDWRDAKYVPASAGRFDLNDYIDYIIGYLEHIGPGAHVVAVCQPSVPVFAAVALMNARKHPCTPASLTMMGGPVDTREAPTDVNALAMTRPFAWFEQNVIATVPNYYPGHGRQVYPGFLQLSGFMTMNLGNHMMSHWHLFKHLVQGDDESADATMAFYDEYRSVCDMTAEFYLQTIDEVFQRHLLPKGEFTHRGELVDFSKITRTAILAVEGERDDISGRGQTKAALTMTSKLPAAKKQYYLAETVGHYGIFNGRRWRDVISPVVKAFIAQHDKA